MPTSVQQTSSNNGQSLQQQPVGGEQMPSLAKKKTVWVIGMVVFFILLSGVSVFYFLGLKSEKGTQIIIPQSNQISGNQNVTPTPLLFVEMTIPYLREKSYSSKLGELEPAYSGNNYTAYTTSYISDGLKINGLLTKPNGEEPKGGWPAIVFVHGYIPPDSYQTQGEAYASYVDYLANNGYVVFKIDLRGHGESEGEPGGAYYSSDYIVDVLSAYAALENAPFVNRNKIGLWGHSMAGNVVMRSWAVKKQIPAVVIWAGAVYTYEDMLEYRINDASYQPAATSTQRMRKRQEIYEKYGSPSAKNIFWQQVAPVNYLDELDGAIQIHHAVDDDVVNIGYSRNLNTLLKKTSVPHELYEYSSGGHNILGTSFTEAMQRTEMFYNTHLK